MRTLLALASVTLLIGAGFGCGDDTTTTTAMDMAVVHDISANPVDMSTLSCSQVLTCERNCGTDALCAAGCVSASSSAAKPVLQALIVCLVDACNPDAGNPAGSCSGVTDLQSASCQACVQAAGNAAATGGPCNTELTNCLSM